MVIGRIPGSSGGAGLGAGKRKIKGSRRRMDERWIYVRAWATILPLSTMVSETVKVEQERMR